MIRDFKAIKMHGTVHSLAVIYMVTYIHNYIQVASVPGTKGLVQQANFSNIALSSMSKRAH